MGELDEIGETDDGWVPASNCVTASGQIARTGNCTMDVLFLLISQMSLPIPGFHAMAAERHRTRHLTLSPAWSCIGCIEAAPTMMGQGDP